MNLVFGFVAIALITASLSTNAADSQHPAENPAGPWPNQLFVGTCYQPIDRTREQIKRDIALMRQSHFRIVRMGDLSWDFFEPREGDFDFTTFDWVMDQMQAAGIKVILDIPGQPAPSWLHHKYPGVDIVNQQGVRLHAAERYMDDISDPDYLRLVARLADTLTKRYARHPALLAIGFNNEIGNGFISYSPADRERFITWLKNKYGSIDALNRAWATQRWSRRINEWDEVELPYADGPGPFERQLDLRRFWSDATLNVLRLLNTIRKQNAPDKPAVSNLWDSASRKGFDYLGTYRDYATFGAMGFYPSDPVSAGFEATMMKAGLSTPIWFNEFTAGGGGYYGTKGRARMWAYFGLLLGSQATLAWTFNSHLGGEEQALFGLLDHDDRPSWKFDEFATIAKEFERLQSLGFPRSIKPKIAIAYSFDNAIASNPVGPSNTVRQYIATPYMTQAHNAFEPLQQDNIDVSIINLAHEDLAQFRLIVVPGMYLLDKASTQALRRFVNDGGTVIMTAYSDKVNEHNQWYATALPGDLTDVFGMRTNEFYTTDKLTISMGDKTITGDIGFYELLEPATAKVLSQFENLDGKPPAITVNVFGKGRAIYVATPAQPAIMAALYRSLYASLDLEPGPTTPHGVFARTVAGHTLYVNATTDRKQIPIETPSAGLLSHQRYTKHIDLDPYGVELISR